MSPRRWALVASLFALGPLGAGCGGEEPPTLAEVPAFELVDQSGAPFRSEELAGKVWVANTIFTTCPTVCPMLTTQMGNLQRRLAEHGEAVQLVSFSVDPENDTPERLTAYAAQHGADTSNWHFLTGEREAMRRAIEEGLHVRMGERQADTGDIPHGTHFVLVGPNGHVRGYYRNDQAGLDQLVEHVGTLVD
ncbi:MAG TPA: SCO family protein [Polyangiaceae bacterium LLY-WYZ-15_(1-7)]|nr:SCO family protein [Polyangiaceae bacterium LLY-WYZ-15_(1-7)]HJL05154.1 SCO family protein [Polyangiaceae bacterium LLY-WYZ-15_(1-7)]HJL13005.1 SCO family protein [Polyangiaceae bacterium LLY-WYZ-15_(1-7)]HJL21642.1 SCO family protein [Polyangiaceae bacterium LLY-WYZ-15_(1-7)]HJL31149.1 SCO family protein [Polyangiaceae bacterium LLY-WYZ-15_(1-7)]